MVYTHCISIGEACPCAYALKANNLRDASYPFDWIFTKPSILLKCMQNDFADFLDKTQYYHENNEKCTDAVKRAQCHHQIYGKAFFRHHCPKCFEDHHEYFVRCVSRFRDSINNEKNNILFVWMNINDKDQEKKVSSTIQSSVLEKIMEYFVEHVKASWKILVLECYQDCDNRQVVIMSETQNYTWIKLEGASKNVGVKYKEPLDNEMISKVLSWFKEQKQLSKDISDNKTSSNIWPYAITSKKKKNWFTCCFS